MKKLTLMCLGVAFAAGATVQETVNLQGTDYTLVTLENRQIGPGAVYTRYRLPDFPLNVNMVRVDVTNPNIRIETSLPGDRAAGTELLTAAAERYDAPNHHAITAQNSNFWIVSTQPQWDAYGASTHNVNMRNGMLAIDSKSLPPWWWWAPEYSGIIGCTENNELWIDRARPEMTFTSAATGTVALECCNKGFRRGEAAFYTPWFGPERPFIPLASDDRGNFDIDNAAECTEVLLTINNGETWSGGRDMHFTVSEVRASNGLGCLGDADLALVSRTADNMVNNLKPGDDVVLNYSWVYNRDGVDVRPELTQAVGGNMVVMRGGEITESNDWDSYNTMVYSRSAYGTSADLKTLYMVVIDKSNHAGIGTSNGCTTREMCDLMRHLGCSTLINVDAGGSAELMVDRHIINTTTEYNPRAVGNGWMVFDVSDDTDTDITSLAFEAVELIAPAGTSYSPRVIAYNQYGTVVDPDFKDYTVTCDASVGVGAGNTLDAAATPTTGSITVTTADGTVSVSKDITIVASEPAMLLSNVVIDNQHPYTLQITTDYNGVTYNFNPAYVAWHTSDPAVCTIDASGTVHAVGNGTAKVSGTVNGTELSLDVTVFTATEATNLMHAPTAWTAKGNTGVSVKTWGDDCTVGYTYGSPRNLATLTLSTSLPIAGIPQRINLTFNSSVPVDKVDIKVTPGANTTQWLVAQQEGTLEAGTDHDVTFVMADMGDAADRSLYPVTLTDLRFSMPAATTYKGSQTMQIKHFVAEYATEGGVDDISADCVDTTMAAAYYTLQGVRVDGANLTPGLYIVRRGTHAAKVLVR